MLRSLLTPPRPRLCCIRTACIRTACIHTAASVLLGGVTAYLALRRLDIRARRVRLARSEQPTRLRDGVGPVVRRKVWAVVSRSPHSAEQVLHNLLNHFPEYMPSAFSWVFRRRSRTAPVREGEKFDILLFLLRMGKVRVERVTPLSFTIRTLRQHPDAGTVKIVARPLSEATLLQQTGLHSFELCIESLVRSSNWLDRAAYVSGIKVLQHSNWEIVLSRALDYAGGEVVRREALVEEYPYRAQR